MCSPRLLPLLCHLPYRRCYDKVGLAIVFRATEDYARALAQLEPALKVYTRQLGPDAPDVGMALNIMAEIYQRQQDYQVRRCSVLLYDVCTCMIAVSCSLSFFITVRLFISPSTLFISPSTCFCQHACRRPHWATSSEHCRCASAHWAWPIPQPPPPRPI